MSAVQKSQLQHAEARSQSRAQRGVLVRAEAWCLVRERPWSRSRSKRQYFVRGEISSCATGAGHPARYPPSKTPAPWHNDRSRTFVLCNTYIYKRAVYKISLRVRSALILENRSRKFRRISCPNSQRFTSAAPHVVFR